MKDSDFYNSFNLSDENRIKFEILMQAIQNLDIAKRSYSVQELQSMNLLDEDITRKSDMERILDEANQFLNVVSDLKRIEKKSSTNYRKEYGEFITQKNVDDKIQIDLSDTKGTAFTLADLSFKANKFTKWICEDAVGLMTQKNTHLYNLIAALKSIYIESNDEKRNGNNKKELLKTLYDGLKDGKYKGYIDWDKNLNPDINREEFFYELYNRLETIWNVEAVLYEIKSQLNKQLVRCLINDNYATFNNWGFSKDENGKWVLNFDPKEAYERYAFHVPHMDKILSEQLITQITQKKLHEYYNTLTSSIRKNNLDRSKATNRLISQYKNEVIILLKKDKITLDAYILAKLFMTESDFNEIKKQYPSLAEKCNQLKELLSPRTKEKTESLSLQDLSSNTVYEQEIRERIEQLLRRHKKIYIQHGKNLDKSACIYALRRHMRDYFDIPNIDVIEINAGEKPPEDGLIIDAGDLSGNKNMKLESENTNEKRKKAKRPGEINADSTKAQKSACRNFKTVWYLCS